MHKYFFLVVALMVVFLIALNYYAGTPTSKITSAKLTEEEMLPEESITIFEQYVLFRSTDGSFQFSYPSSWTFIDTTESLKDANVVQSWTLSSPADSEVVQSTFVLKKGSGIMLPLTLISCTKPSVTCDKETYHGIAYTKAVEETSNGNIITHEAQYGDNIITVTATIPVGNSIKRNTDAWQTIVSSFRMYK